MMTTVTELSLFFQYLPGEINETIESKTKNNTNETNILKPIAYDLCKSPMKIINSNKIQFQSPNFSQSPAKQNSFIPEPLNLSLFYELSPSRNNNLTKE